MHERGLLSPDKNHLQPALTYTNLHTTLYVKEDTQHTNTRAKQ